MKSCIFKNNFCIAGRVFYFVPTSSGDKNFDREHVKVYLNKDDENPFRVCHISQIIEIPEEECKMSLGSRCVTLDHFLKICKERERL